MARNPVQFQKGISLNEFLSLYGTEEQGTDQNPGIHLYTCEWLHPEAHGARGGAVQ